MAKDKRIYIRISENELDIIRENAEKAKMSVSKYIRLIAIKGEIKQYDFRTLNAFIIEIGRIGTNINQITALINRTQKVLTADYENLFKEFRSLNKKFDYFLSDFEKDNLSIRGKK